ncbi:MAG: DUF4254 domain-containing protein [SAR324 cluster bacterium]|nr:DUF4254 domain-containing protein [SAR324 cluster bacterium]
MFDVNELLQSQLEHVAFWHNQPFENPEGQSFEAQALLLYHYNFELWHQEDLARDKTASAHDIAKVKRAIDGFNQQRQDMIEKLDECIISYLQSKKIIPASNAPMNSETPGSVIDRLSINALKIYHMREETLREDASEDHRQRCQSKLNILEEQREDLGNCLHMLLNDLLSGCKYLKIYRQMKMYNDATLNPVLYETDKRIKHET